MNIRNNNPSREIFKLNEDRHYRQIVSQAYSLFIAHTATWFKSVLPLCIMGGLLGTSFLYVQRVLNGPFLLGISAVYALGLFFTLGVMMNVAYHVLANYEEYEVMTAFPLFKQFPQTINKSVKAVVLLVLSAMFAGVSLMAASFLSVYTNAVWIVALLLIAFMAIPFTLSTFHQVVSACSIPAALKFGFRNTFRYLGSTLFLLFVSFSVILLLGIIFCLPLEILNISISLSDVAVLQGDPTDLPTYVFAEYYLLGIVLFTLFAYTLVIYIIPQILQAVSLRLRCKEKNSSAEF